MRLSANRRGFTLIEVLVGLVLLTVGALGLAAMSATVSHANRDATNRTRADQLLHERIEELQTEEYGDIVSGEDEVAVADVGFQLAWEVEEDTPVDDVKRIVMEATWQESGRTLRMRTATLVSKAEN